MKNTGGGRIGLYGIWTFTDVILLLLPPKLSGTLLAQLRVSLADVGGLKRDEQDLPFYDTVARGAWHWLCHEQCPKR
jgi:hypothetical protein